MGSASLPADRRPSSNAKRNEVFTTTRGFQPASPSGNNGVGRDRRVNRANLSIHRKTDICDQNIQRLVQTRRTNTNYFAQAVSAYLRGNLFYVDNKQARFVAWGLS